MAVIDINLGVAAVAGGTVDAITVTLNPAVTPFNLMLVFFRSSGVNTSTTPTVNVNSSGAKTITKKNGEALVAGDIDGDHLIMYDLANTRWELLNPASEQTITGTDRQVLFFDGNDNPAGDADFVFEDLGLGFGRSLNLASLSDSFLIGNPVEGSGEFFIVWFNSASGVWDMSTVSPILATNLRSTTQSAGDNSTNVATTAYVDNAVAKQAEVIAIACSDLTSNLATGTSKGYIRMPFAMTLTSVRASVIDAPTGAILTVDINESGSTILSTKLTIDISEKTSTTAATPAVISDTALADDVEITIDIDQIGSTNAGKGLIVYLIGTRA